MAQRDPRDPYTVEQAMADARQGVAGMNPEVQTLARSGITEPARRALAEQQNQVEDIEREQRQAQDAQQREAERQQREADQIQRADQARQVREASAAGIETTTDTETGRRTIARHDDGAAKWKAGPVGQPVEQPPMHGPGLSGESQVSVTTQRFRDDRGREVTEPVRQETDPKTGERYIETKDAFGRPQRKVLGIDPKHAQRQALDQEEGKIALRGNALAQTRLQFEPRWQPVKAEYLKAKDDLESIKPIERNPTDGSWFRTTESGKLEYFDQVAVAKHFDRRNKAKARFEQAERAFKPEDAKNAQLSQAERQVKLDRLKLDARRKRLDLGLPDEDGGIAETLVQAESGERTQEAEAAAAAADEVINTPKPIAESEVLTAALGSVAGIEDAVIEGTDVGYSWIYRPDGAKIGRIDNRSGQPVVVIDSEATDLQSHIAKTGGTGAVPVYAADHPERPPLAEEAGWAAGVLQTVTNPVAGPLNDGQAQMPAIDPNPMLREMGASHAEIIQKAKDGRLSIKTAEALLKTVYDDTLLAPDPTAPETRQAWLSENPDTMAAFQKATATRDHETLARLQGEFANDWYAKNQHKPGVTFEMQRQIRGQGLPEKTMGEVASGLAKSAGGIGVDAAGSFGGMIGGLAAFVGLKVAGTVSDTAAELGDSQQAVLGRAFTNFNNGLKDFHSKHATAEGKTRANTLTQSDRNLRSLIERRHEMGPEQFREQFFAAASQIGRDAYALHQLSEEDGWKVDIEDFDIAADAPLRNALLSYAETGDPAQWESFQRRLLMDKGSRQADSLAQDNIDPKQGRLAAAFAGGVNAPPQEMMMEALFTVATYGTGKALTAAAKATGQSQRLNRIRRAASGIGAEFKAAGRFTDTLANPASKAKRAVNKATDILKVQAVEGAGEGVEGTIAGMAEPGATPESALESGMLEAVGGVIMGPVLGGAGALSARYGESVDRKKQVAKFAGWYNRTNADTEGFTPISPQDAEAALSMLDPAEHQALIDADQAAGQELKAAVDSLALSKPFALSPKQRESLETEAAELERALNDDATSDQTGKPAMAPAARESATEKLAEIQSRLRDADEAPVSRYSRALAGSIQARTAVSSYVARVVEAAQSVKGQPAAVRARTLGLTKVATGRVDLLTGAERSAIGGLTTRDGAPYFATVGGRDVFTAEGRAELLQDDPLIGSLVQTDESRALIDQSAAAQAQTAPAQDKAKTSQPVGAQPPPVPQAQKPAPQAQAEPASPPSPAKPADTQPAAKDKKPDITRPIYRVEKRGGKSAVVADGLPEPVWEGKEEDSAAALKRAQDAADSPLAVANRAKRRLEARYPALKGKIRLDDESPATGGGGVLATPDGILFNMADLEREMPLYDPEARDARVDAGLDEEVIHFAQFAAAEKMAGNGNAADYYEALWKEFTPEQQQAGADIYQGNWNDLEDWAKAAEIVRMLIQAKRSGRVTEVTKAFSKAFPEKMLELLAAALEYLKGLGSKVSPRIQATIDAVEAILAEHAGTAGNRTKAEAAAADAAVQGEAVIEGTDAKLTTPNNERTVEVKQTVVELGQLVGSGDPRFPSLAFQPRDRSGAASAAQLDEMARNLASNPEQYRRYLEGSTTDTGRPLVAPLMEGGKQALDDQGRPLFYVLSGNGRRNAIAEADRRGTAGQFYDSIREATGATAEKPVPVSIYQPADGADAIQIAELSNRDAGLSVSNTEQAIRDARDVEPILSLWSPDESGNASAASNRDFIRAFVQATGDTGILAGDGSLTEEGALRIDRALLATLLGPRNKPVLEMIFNRDLGLRNAISGIASEAGNLLRIAVEKPAYDLSAVLADALRQAVEARSAIEAGTATTAADYFDQGDLFADNSDSPAKQLARALAETRSKKAVREILGTYRQAADQIDTTTEDMFGGVATRDDLIARALDARPFERIAQEVAAEFGAQSSIARKLAAGTAAVKRLTPSDRRSLAAAIGYEVERLREGIPSAEEFQATFEPGQLEPRAAFLQRWLDSHTPDSIDWEAMGKARAAVLAASPTRDIEVPNEVFRSLAKTIHSRTKKLRAYDAEFQGLVREAAGDNAEWFPLAGPVKKVERSVEKAQSEWLDARKQGMEMSPAEVAASLKDIVRASIIVQDAADFPAAIESIGRRFKILRIKNRWENPLPSGYADILINVETPLGESEIQLHIPEMLVAKEGWFPGLPEEFKPLVPLEMTGHKLYEEQRTLWGQPSEKERLDALDEMMFALYGAALRAHFARTNSRPPATWLNRAFTSSSVAGTSLKLTGFVSPNDPSALIARVALSTNKPGRSVSPSSANRAPGGTVKTASITPDTPSAAGENQAVSENILYSSGTLDLFGPDLFGPVAETKRKAVAAAKKNPAARAGVAKQIAAIEKVDDLDLFSESVVKALANPPAKRQRRRNDSDSGQLGFAFGSDLPAGQQAVGPDRAPRVRPADGVPSGDRGSRGGDIAGDDLGSARGDLAGGSRNDGAPDDADGRGGRPVAGDRAGRDGDRQPRRDDAGRRSLTERERPPLDSPDRNFRIGKDTVLAEGGAVTRIRNNIAAIDLLRALETEDRNPTTAEKQVLAKFVGWGGLPQVFDEKKARDIERGEIETRRSTARKYTSWGAQYSDLVASMNKQADDLEAWRDKWGDHYKRLRELLTEEEWQSARDSVINAHYTSPTVIGGMWDAVKRFGFQGGNILEPAGGVGHYFGLMPSSIVGKSRLFGVELDSISGRIFQKLYPEAEIEVTGFQDSTLPENSQDLVISNVPFANITISDATLAAQPDAPAFSLHNYFFEKALRMARPGGIVAFITTSHTMDSNIAQRKWLAERAEFVGAIRLPNDAFKGNANTDVVTDIIYLRKPDGGPAPVSNEWTGLREVEVAGGGKIQINEWFADHPEMVLGRLADDGSMFAGRKEMTVHSDGADIAEALRNANDRLPANIMGTPGERAEVRRVSATNSGAKLGAFTDVDGVIQIAGSTDTVSKADEKRVRAFMDLRDTLNDLYKLESDPEANDTQVEAARRRLNERYQSFKTLYKPLHDRKNRAILSSDPDFYRTLGLEIPVKDGAKTTTYDKADVFTRRVLTPRQEPKSADTVEDAMLNSFRWRGRLDPAYIGELLNIPVEEAEARLLATPSAFRDPATGLVEHRTSYLSGNVRRKLRDARLAAQSDPAFARNVEELEAAMPEDVPWGDIDVKMGSTWVPSDIYRRFLDEKVFGRNIADVMYNEGLGEIVSDSFAVRTTANASQGSQVQWGTERKSPAEIAEAVLNMRDPLVKDTIDEGNGKTSSRLNAKETDKARQAADRMKTAFLEWLSGDPEIQDTLHRIYNESYNSHVIAKHDGSFMQLPWVSEKFDLYPSKKHVVWRALQDGSMIVAHGVGGGKTIIGTAIALESKRLGFAKKPLIVVHNATLEQFATTISQMAPTARVLIARKEDLAGPKRKEFMGRIASGDWDAVVMAHSTFDLIPDDPAWEQKQLGDLMDELGDAIEAMGESRFATDTKKIKDPSVKELVKMRNRLKERMSKLQERRTDDTLTFQEMGFDTMVIDEAHRYKKVPFVTKQSNIAGIDTGFSKRGSAVQLRAKWVQAKNKGRGVFLMTGTPVTNTLGESWNMVRMVRPDLTKEFKVQSFDRFVSTFAEVTQSGELRPNGSYKAVSRLSKLANIPEWNRFWGMAADVKMGDDMDVKGRPKIKGGKPELRAVPRTPQVETFIGEVTKIIDRFDAMSGKEKRENSHIPLLTYNASRMAAIDIRLINPDAKDEAGSKVNVAIDEVLRLHGETAEQKGTQVIFADSYRPMRTTKLDLSAAEFEMEKEKGDDADTEDGFNLYHDIREKLVARGIPREEIAIISEAKNDKQKEALFAAVNEGKVRVIMGSTETLGTGVNMQRRMIAAHHLDVPWTPAGLEQRDGRVYRQGNMWAELGRDIEILRYGMKDTLDAALWQKLETKERFIKQAVSGAISARSIEDDTGLINLAEQKAILSGPEGLAKFNLDEKSRQLGNEWRAHRNRKFDIERRRGQAMLQRDRDRDALEPARREAAAAAPLAAEEQVWTVEGSEPATGEDARKLIDAAFKARRKLAGEKLRPAESEAVMAPLRVTVNGVPLVLKPANINEDVANANKPDLRWKISWKPESSDIPRLSSTMEQIHPGSLMTAIPATARNIVARPEGMVAGIAQTEKDLEVFAREMEMEFPKLEEFREVLIEQANLYRRMGLSEPFDDGVYRSAGIDLAALRSQQEAAVEAAAAETETAPTDAQKEAGNYKKGKVTLHGMPISIENPRGSERSGTDKDGKPWSVTMPHHYGYFLRTEGKDGDHLDTFIGPDVTSTRVFVVNQVNPDSRRFDEHKVMLGFPSRQDAINGYFASYSPGWKGLGDMVETDLESFKAWMANGDTTKRATPASFPRAEGRGAGLEKPAATLSSSATQDAAYLAAVKAGDIDTALVIARQAEPPMSSVQPQVGAFSRDIGGPVGLGGWDAARGMSNNAARAENEGRMQAPDFLAYLAEELGIKSVPPAALQSANTAAGNTFREYHHVGSKRENVDFYDPDRIAASPRFWLGLASYFAAKPTGQKAASSALRKAQEAWQTMQTEEPETISGPGVDLREMERQQELERLPKSIARRREQIAKWEPRILAGEKAPFDNYLDIQKAELVKEETRLAELQKESPTRAANAADMAGARETVPGTGKLNSDVRVQSSTLAAAPTLSDTTAEALATMTPLYRNVFAAVMKGEPVADIAARYSITDRAVKNITDQVRARIRTLTAASSAEGLKPAMKDGKFNGGRPDLALSTNPAVAAVDQIRQQENVPDVRGHAEVNAEAEAMLSRDYAGTFDALLAKARDLQPFTDTEVAAAKILISRETLAGKIQTPEERRKIAKLITGYRDIGTETARSLAIRRDPHKTPAERHAQYIAEALFTPDPETRERMRKNRGLQDSILDQWLTRANGIKEALKADGFDIDATLAAFQEATAARKEAAAAAPRAAAAVEDEIRRLDPTSRAVVEAIRSGSNWTAAAMSAGIDIADAKARYAKFREKVTDVMRGAARKYLAATLSASPTATESSILAELGLPDPDDIAESSTVPSVNRQKRKAAPRKTAKPSRPLAQPDMTLDDYADRPLDGTRTLPPRPMQGIDGRPIDGRGEFAPANPDPIGKELEPWKHGPPISGGLFDLNDPLAMKKVMDAFALARGTKFDALLEFWRMSILTGPQTHVVNISSNVLHGIYDLLPRRAVEAGINGMLGIVGQGSPEAATFGEFAGMARQLYAAAARAGRNALSSWRLESRVFEAQALALAQQLDFSGVKADYIPPALGGKLGTIMRSLSFRAMTAADEMMKSFLGQLEAAAHAHRIAKSEGLKRDAYAARIAELMEPGSIAWVRAVDSAKRVTFQSDLNPDNPQLLGRLDQVAEALKKARRARYGGKLLTFFLPFIDTPTNIFKIAMEMSPMGAAIALFDAAHALKVKLVRGDLTKEEADAAAEEIYNRARLVRDLTNQTIAWGAFFALQGMTEADDDDETGLPMVTGSVSYTNTRRGERDVMFRTMPPQSIRIGNAIFSYRRFEPFATALSGAVDAIRAIRVSGGVNDEALSLYMGGIKDGLNDKTFLSGISGLINAFENPERFVPTLAGNIVTGFVPNFVRQPIRETDEFIRDDKPRPDEGFFKAIGKKLGSTVAPGMFPARIDVWGNPIRRHNGPASDSLLRILDPTDANLGANVDPIDRYILNWNLSADAKARLAIEPIGDSVSSRGQRITLTPAEQEEANRRAGQRARASLGDSWDWRNPSPQGIDRIRDAVRNAQDAERDRIRATKQPDPDQRN